MSEIATREDRFGQFSEWLESQEIRGALERAVPRHVSAGRLARIALTQLKSVPGLLECHPPTVLGGIMEAAVLGLEIGTLSQAWLLPYKNRKADRMDAQLIIGYRGLAQLAYRSDKVIGCGMGVVYEEDEFDFDQGAGWIRHKPDLAADRSKDPLAYYGVIHVAGGGHVFEVLTLEEVKAIRNSSPGKNSLMWTRHFHEGGKKSAFRRAMKLAPISTEAQRAVALDEMAEMGAPQDLGDAIEVDAFREGDPEEAGDGEGAAAAEPEAKPEPVKEVKFEGCKKSEDREDGAWACTREEGHAGSCEMAPF